MKILFLDIDGVCNCEGTRERVGKSGVIGMDPAKVALVNEIVEKTGAKVVLSSTWRLDKNWRENMQEWGLKCEFVDRTPHLGGWLRGFEISSWLEHQKNKEIFLRYPKSEVVLVEEPIEKFAILDDDGDMLLDQPLFKTSWQTGLTREIADAVINFLNS